MQGQIVTKRLFVGGLSNNVTTEEIQERFSRFGKIGNLSLKKRTDDQGNPVKSFAHLDIEGDESNIKKCFNAYQNTKWKGCVLQLQYAKESFLDKLTKEREEEAIKKTDSPCDTKSPGPRKDTSEIVSEVKGVPGTPVPGKTDWIVGKYGRALPVLKLKKSYKVKMVKHDPSKFCHAAKIFKEDNTSIPSDASCEKLTWEINTPDSEITKKRKGDFPQLQREKKTGITISEVLKRTSHMADVSDTNKSYLNGIAVGSNQSEDFEIVKLGAEHNYKVSASRNHSNKFDSDIESDYEPEEASPNSFSEKSKEKVKKRPPEKLSKTGQANLSTEKVAVQTKSEAQKGKGNVKTPTGNVYEQNRIPAFKGLQMLGILSDTSKVDQKKENVNIVTNTNSEMDASDAKKGELHEIDISHGESANHSQAQKNKVSVSGKNSQLKKSKGSKLTDNTASIDDVEERMSEVNSSNDRKSVSSSGGNVESTTKHSIPAFKGLKMLPDISTGQKEVSKRLESSPEAEFSTSKLKKATKSPEKQTLQVSPAATNQSSSSLLAEGLDKKDKSKTEDYDSSCSADTDELLTRYKKKKGLVTVTSSSASSSPVKETELPEKLNVSSNQARDISSIDQNISVSEYVAGISDFVENPFPSSSYAEDDSYDSDLDSNDFALVARKLAQKAAATSKKVSAKHVSRDGQNRTSLNKAVDKSGESSKLEKTINQDAGMKAKQKADETKASLKARLLNIANDQDESGQVSEKAEKKAKLKKDNLPANPSQLHASAVVQDKTKQATDNEKRLQAVKERIKQKQQQQSLMQKALQNVDTKSSKRVVFDSSDSEETGDDSHISSENEKILKDSSESAKKTEKDKVTLFDSSSDEDAGDSDYDEMFQSKPHFEGKKGEKLMKLDRKIGDSRFKLDARFVESDSEEEAEHPAEAGKEKDDTEKVLEKEKAANLKVLENIIGKTTLDRFSEKIKKNTLHIIDMNAVRFDPTKVSSQQRQSLPEGKGALRSKNALFPQSTRKEEPKTKQEAKQPQEAETVDQSEEQRNQTDLKKKRKAETPEVETEPSHKKRKKAGEIAREETAEKESSVDKLVKKEKKKADAEAPESATTDNSASKVKGTSKVQLAPSLISWFKDKANHDNPVERNEETFSLLKQFDQKAENNEDDSMEAEDGNDKPKSKTPLSGLFGKNDLRSGTLMGGKKTDLNFSTGAESSGNSSSEDDSHEEESEAELHLQQQDSVRDEETENDEKEEQDETYIDPEMDFDKDLKNAGRVDIRFTKEQWLQRWEEIRPALIKTYKRKHKEALKSKRAQGEMKRRKAFLKNSKKGHWVRRKR